MGKVYLVGAGPGAADLITLRGAQLLKRADIVFYDALVQPEMLALAEKAKLVAVGKRCSRISTDQRFINRNLVEAATKYDVVVRLKGGDPTLFGRLQEEIDGLVAAGVQYEVVPGVTAALAGSAEIGISLTRRGVSRSVVFVTPRVGKGEDESDWARAVAAADTAVLYMAAGQAEAVVRILQSHGVPADMPVAIVENASLSPSKKILTVLGSLARNLPSGDSGPILLMLGRVFEAASDAAMINSVIDELSSRTINSR